MKPVGMYMLAQLIFLAVDGVPLLECVVAALKYKGKEILMRTRINS